MHAAQCRIQSGIILIHPAQNPTLPLNHILTHNFPLVNHILSAMSNTPDPTAIVPPYTQSCVQFCTP